MLIGAAVVAVPIALNLPQSWLGGVIVLALAGNGVVLLVNSTKTPAIEVIKQPEKSAADETLLQAAIPAIEDDTTRSSRPSGSDST